MHLLKEQLEEMGLINVTLSEKGTLMATLPANVPGDIPAIGFISHVDTSPVCSGKMLIRKLLKTIAVAILRWVSAMKFYHRLCSRLLHQLLGQTLITTDGKALLGVPMTKPVLQKS